VRRLTNDASDYRQVTVSAGDAAIAAVRVNRVSNLWLADPGGGTAQAITKFTNAENSPVGFVTAFDGSIVFIAARDQSLQLWAIGTEGGEARALSGSDGFAANPRPFRGGVAYSRIEPGGVISVWRVDLDGTHAKNLTPKAPAQIVDVARDGSSFTYLQLDSAAETWAMPVSGGTPKSLGPKIAGGPFSPDGSQVVGFDLTTGADGLLHVKSKLFRADGTPTDVNVDIPQRDANTLAWSPDGASFTLIDQSDPARNLERVRIGGSGVERLTHFTDGRTTAFEWSPDGSRIAVARRIGDASGVWVTAPDGSKPVSVAQFPADEIFGIHWTQDGKHVVVNAGKRSSDAVMIRNFR
jgi:Tol biopolymer transport system component